MLVTARDILVVAKANKFGVVAPNVCNEDTVKAAISAAEEMKAPVILDVSQWAISDMVAIGHMIEYYAMRTPIPVAVQLDHSTRFEDAIWAVRSGFTSIMADRSLLPHEENIAQVAEIARIAHTVNMSVEAALGHVGTGEEYGADPAVKLTDPDLAAEFVHRSGCDMLAVAIGTARGKYGAPPKLDFERLAKINKAVPVPLVLHGGSGTGEANLIRAIAGGITKIDIAYDLFITGEKQIHSDNRTAYFAYDKITDGYKDRLLYYMDLFGERGVAKFW